MSLLAQRVPPEVWQPVFEYVADENGSSRSILSLTSVCNKWKSYGGDLLYRHIHLKKPHKLNQLADRLVRASAEGSNPAEKTVSLRLSFRGLNVSYVDSLLCVLHHTSELRVFRAQEPVMPSVLLTMPRQTMMDLSLVVGTPSGASLAILHSFTHLTSLVIYDDLNPVIPNYPLVLPSLHTLQWTASAFISPSQVQYLARSKLPALKRLNFGLPLLSAADAHLLRTFFLAHTHVQRIELVLPFIALAGLFSSLGAPTLAFPSSVPPASIASLHNPAVRTLAFRTKLPGDDVWPLLDAFVRAPPGMLRAIIVSTPSRFTWTCASETKRTPCSWERCLLTLLDFALAGLTSWTRTDRLLSRARPCIVSGTQNWAERIVTFHQM